MNREEREELLTLQARSARRKPIASPTASDLDQQARELMRECEYGPTTTATGMRAEGRSFARPYFVDELAARITAALQAERERIRIAVEAMPTWNEGSGLTIDRELVLAAITAEGETPVRP